MAHLIRGKQAGVQNDLSLGLSQDMFRLDDIDRFGISSQITQIAYDPVQSLLAVGTRNSTSGKGEIYVFGQKRICVTLPLPGKGASVKTLRFCADKIVCLDNKNDLSIYSLEAKSVIVSYSPPGTATCLETDPALDYALIGTQNGDVLAYDMDRESPAPFRIPNLWHEHNVKARGLPVASIAFHPRDIGTLLVGYSEGAVIYSFKQNKALRHFHYQLPRGAPGGDSDPATTGSSRSPRLTQALWHPTGTFILTGHEDSSIVIWDAKDGRMILARTLTDTHIDRPGAPTTTTGSSSGAVTIKEPLFRIAWCANVDPDDTAILIAGGASATLPTRGLALFELGRTPNYATASWELLTQHFEAPRRQRILPTPPNAQVVDFCLIPRRSPHFAGAQDPIAVIALLASGELLTLSFPSGLPINPSNQLHVSTTLVHPFVTRVALAPVERSQWLGMTETRFHGPPILIGGAEMQRPSKRYDHRNIIQTAHTDASIRLWDLGHGDRLENEQVVQVDVSRALGRFDNIDVSCQSLAGASGEFAAGLKTGEVIVWRWGHNKRAGQDPLPAGPNERKKLIDITERKDPSLTDGLMPITLLDWGQGSVAALKLSDVGFVAAASEGGGLVVIDLRGPAIIYDVSIYELLTPTGHGSIRRNTPGQSKLAWINILEFSVMTLDGDSYSSILLHAGTTEGHIATFKILPSTSGRYSVQFVGATHVEDKIITIYPLHADTGHPAFASKDAVAGLRNGSTINGVILATTTKGARIFRPASRKGASKTWDQYLCESAAVARFGDSRYTLVGLFGDGYARCFSIPALKEIGSVRLGDKMDTTRFSEAVITQTGDVLGWCGPSELAFVNVFGTGSDSTLNPDKIFNPEAIIPPRPTISNMQWISGTQYITPADMDVLIGGPDRPPSKRMIAQARADEAAARASARKGGAPSVESSGEGYFTYLQRQINERTEKLNIMGDSMDKLENNSSGWADDVSKFVAKQKRGLVLGAMKSKFGL